MKALILALGISCLAIPVAAQGTCLRISDFYTTCQDGRGNQYSIQTFGPNTFINGNSYYSRSPYYHSYPGSSAHRRPGDRPWKPAHYRRPTSHHTYSFSNTFKSKKSRPWQYEPYWQQPWKKEPSSSPQFSTYWQRNPWQRPTYRNDQNLYLDTRW
ncbi:MULTISPECIES: hypothetical protein [Cyanophyceae]|uniref:hypothetical protein n=1 Tax=Cyanophyceae TaxID=3028117 RepID=UPI00016DCCD1|nr:MULTISPECIES: hypothetical protein [Cyanophyceae]ACA99464.1 hypothetical protein SYNPCC7002_A1473 [Picosynechococcus sp. PCC 7002]SMH30700.1 hypothetical protein SAMN06272755_0224 [Picosynechococcus sp. OG1]SMQ83950.1 hypothetical protein SAMN06272774_2600 [Synechococcus sp. 7002]